MNLRYILFVSLTALVAAIETEKLRAEPVNSKVSLVNYRQGDSYVLPMTSDEAVFDRLWQYRFVLEDKEVAARHVVHETENRLKVRLPVNIFDKIFKDSKPTELSFRVVGYSKGTAVFFPSPITLILPPRFPIKYELVEFYKKPQIRRETGPRVNVRKATPDYNAIAEAFGGDYRRKFGRDFIPYPLSSLDMLPVSGTACIRIPAGCRMLRKTLKLHSTVDGEPNGLCVKSIATAFSDDGRTASIKFKNYSPTNEKAWLTVDYELPELILKQQQLKIPTPPGTLNNGLPIGRKLVVPLSPSFRTFVLTLKLYDGRVITITPEKLKHPGIAAEVKQSPYGKRLILFLDWSMLSVHESHADRRLEGSRTNGPIDNSLQHLAVKRSESILLRNP